MSTRGTIVVAGSVAAKPHHGGHAWVFLQYLLGFRRLGWDVLFLDEIDPAACVDRNGVNCSLDDSVSCSYLTGLMEQFGLGDAFALSSNCGERTVGMTRAEVRVRVRGSAFLLNMMGFLRDEELMGLAPRRVFLDIDPGFGQMWKELGLADVFRGHDDLVTIGENLGRPDCAIPDCGWRWITTPQPVVLEHWPRNEIDRGTFTSVVSWRGAYGPVEYEGKTYGLRAHEFRKFAALPKRAGRPFELALDIHPAEIRDLALLADNGWSLVEPRHAAGDPWKYRDYIGASHAEFMVAKNMYVQSASGWLSDRSICYLASGKPVLAQDTGLKRLYPTEEGLLTFTTLEDAVAGVESIDRDYRRHSRAARALAEERFDSDRVLGQLLCRLGVA